MSLGHARYRRLIDAHFAATIRPAGAQQLFSHLGGCAACKRYFERHQLLAELDPSAPAFADRLAAGLAIRPRTRRWLFWGAAPALLAAAVLLLFIRPSEQSFVARGSATSDLAIYRVQKSKTERLPPSARIARNDELAFAYANPERYEHLMVFAVDEAGRVYWYYPAWVDGATDPAALTIDANGALTELGEAVAQDYRGRSLSLYGLFCHDARTVRAVEKLVAGQALSEPNVRLVRYQLDVSP
jgi:hypothetical protein